MLIASPVMGDSRFERTLIYLCAHGPEHAMGIVVNKPMGGLRLPELLVQLGVPSSIYVPDRPVLIGGPVDRERGFVLHTADYDSGDATLQVSDRVGLTATKDVLEAMAGPGGPEQAVLALGYAGWGEGQLESEIQANAWLVCDASDDLVFGEDLELKWARALRSIGVSPDKLPGASGQA